MEGKTKQKETFWNFEKKKEKQYTVEPRLSGLVGTSVKSPDNRESG